MGMRPFPKTIVLMASYNSENTVADAVLSLFETSTYFHILVVDDGSRVQVEDIFAEDARFDAIRDRVFILRNPNNLGIVPSLNRGLEWIMQRPYAYILRFDSDDIAAPDCVYYQEKYMDDHPDIDVVGGKVQFFYDFPGDTHIISSVDTDQQSIRRTMWHSSAFSNPALMIHRRVFDQIGLYDPIYLYAEDFEFQWRCVRFCKVANQNVLLVFYRLSHNQVSSLHRKRQIKSRIKVLVREIRRGEIGCVLGLIKSMFSFMVSFQSNAKIKNGYFNLRKRLGLS
jgi:glycosyltransferase involved in cell wall biosynthesis